MNEASERDKLRATMMAAMSPLCNEHSRWYGWPGTWAFAEAALSVLDAERVGVPAVQPQEPVGHVNMRIPSGCGDGIKWTGAALPHGTPLYAAPQARQPPANWRELLGEPPAQGGGGTGGVQPVEAPSLRALTEAEVLEAIQSCRIDSVDGRAKLTYDSGPYDVTSPTRVAMAFADAVVQKCRAQGVLLGVQPSRRGVRV